MDLFEPPEGNPRADVAPNMLGNFGVKEIILAASCYYDRNSPKTTSIPIVIVAPSGGGKSSFFEGMKETFGEDADIYPVDSITPGQMKGMVKAGKVIKATLANVSMFDELNKWSMNYLENVLIPVFGAEQGVRWREGKKIADTTGWQCVPIGTLLPYWTDFENRGNHLGNKKIHDIEQIMRRCLMVKLEEGLDSDEFLQQYVELVASGLFDNVEYTETYDMGANRERIKYVIRDVAAPIGSVSFYGGTKAFTAATKRFTNLAKRIRFSERIVYDKAFSKNALWLTIGMAKRYGRSIVYQDDVDRVCSLLEGNAKALGFYQKECEECGYLNRPDAVKCGRKTCRKKLSD